MPAPAMISSTWSGSRGPIPRAAAAAVRKTTIAAARIATSPRPIASQPVSRMTIRWPSLNATFHMCQVRNSDTTATIAPAATVAAASRVMPRAAPAGRVVGGGSGAQPCAGGGGGQAGGGDGGAGSVNGRCGVTASEPGGGGAGSVNGRCGVTASEAGSGGGEGRGGGRGVRGGGGPGGRGRQ